MKTSGNDASVLVVWEPVLPPDFRGAPTAAVRARLGPAVRQFWDPGRLLSKHIVEATLADPARRRPDDFDRETVVWDVVAVYPPGARWRTVIPEPSWFDGPVVRVAGELRRRLSAGRPGP